MLHYTSERERGSDLRFIVLVHTCRHYRSEAYFMRDSCAGTRYFGATCSAKVSRLKLATSQNFNEKS